MSRRDSEQANRRVDRRAVLRAAGATGLVGVTGLAGCLGNVGGGGTDTITYGVLSPISGAYKGLGPFQRNGAKLAIEELQNDDDFGLEVEAVYKDTGTTAETAVSEAKKAIEQDGANYLMGAISSSVAIALNTEAEDQEVIYNPGGAAVPVTGSECNEYVFRAETNTAQIAEAVAEYTVNNLGTNVWWHIADYAYGESVLNRTESRMQDANSDYSRAGLTKSQLGTSNYDSYISEIGNSNADVVIAGMTGGDLITFVKQAVSKGLKDQLTIVSPTLTFQVVRGALKGDAYGTYGGVRYLADLDTGTNQSFVSAYSDEYDSMPGNFARVGYQSIMMTAKGATEAGTADPTEVKDVLGGMEMETIFGSNQFRACDHQAMNPTWMGKIVEPESGDVGDVSLESKFDGQQALRHLPCEETGCDL